MAALTVQGGLVKNKMKGGVYSRPPPLTCFFSIGTPSILFRQICWNLWEQLFPQICRNSILFKILPLGPWEASLNGNQVGNDSLPKDFYSMMLRCVVVHCVSKTFQCHLCFKTESLMCNSELCLSPPEIRNKNLKEPNLITAF